jgi:hypothetical protein
MARVVDGTLDGEQALEVDPVGRRTTLAALDAPWPGSGEREGDGGAQGVDAVGRNPDLEDFIRVGDVQQGWTSVLGEGAVGPLHVVGLGIRPSVDIFGSVVSRERGKRDRRRSSGVRRCQYSRSHALASAKE